MGDKLREDVFQQLFSTGGIKFVDLRLGPDGRAVVVYTQLNGIQGVVHTKRGAIKYYKPETALAFLRKLGVVSVKVDMAAWQLATQQGSLL